MQLLIAGVVQGAFNIPIASRHFTIELET